MGTKILGDTSKYDREIEYASEENKRVKQRKIQRAVKSLKSNHFRSNCIKSTGRHPPCMDVSFIAV